MFRTSYMPGLPSQPRGAAGTGDSLEHSVLAEAGILDDTADPAFDRVTRLGAKLLRASVMLVLAPDQQRQLVKSSAAPAGESLRREAPLVSSLCQQCLAQVLPLIVPDGTHLLSTTFHAEGSGVRAYLGVRLVTFDNRALGVLCCLTYEPRSFSSDDVETLAELAAILMSDIEQRRSVKQLIDREACYRGVVENLPNTAVLLFDRDLRYSVASGEQLVMSSGFSQAELEGRTLYDIAPEASRAVAERLYRATLAGRSGKVDIKRGEQWYATHTLPIRDAAGTVRSGMLMAYEITAFKRAQDELVQKSIILQSILENMSDGLIVSDSEGKFLIFNPAAERMVGFGTGDAPSNAVEEYGLFTDDGITPLAADQVPLARALRGEHAEQVELFVRAPEWPEGRWHSVTSTPLLDPSGRLRGGICVGRDITNAKRAERELREQTVFVELLSRMTLSANQSESSRAAMQQCIDLVCTHMSWPIGHVYTFEAATCQLIPTDLWHLDDAEKRQAFVAATLQTRLSPNEELPGRVLASGKAEWSENVGDDANVLRAARAVQVGIRGGFAFPVLVGTEVVAVLEFFSEVAGQAHGRLLALMENVGLQLGRAVERERHVAKIEALSVTDELTGLCNRRGFLDLTRRQLKLLKRQNRSALLLFVDLDGLKQINDTLGHEAGDAAIVDAARVLRTTFRDTDVLARLGGDEFAILVPEADQRVAERILERLEKNRIARNRAQERSFAIEMSVGVTEYDPAAASSIEELLAHGDASMYRQKQLRKVTKAASAPPSASQEKPRTS